MSDLVVTVPKGFWRAWIAEGDAAGEAESGEAWAFYTGGHRPPPIGEGERLYIVAWGRLRGYALVNRVVLTIYGYAIRRRGGAVACTLDEPVKGFRGWRYRWWERDAEAAFPDWRDAGVAQLKEPAAAFNNASPC